MEALFALFVLLFGLANFGAIAGVVVTLTALVAVGFYQLGRTLALTGVSVARTGAKATVAVARTGAKAVGGAVQAVSTDWMNGEEGAPPKPVPEGWDSVQT